MNTGEMLNLQWIATQNLLKEDDLSTLVCVK